MTHPNRESENWFRHFWTAVAAIVATAAMTFWLAPIMSVFISLLALMSAAGVVWLVGRASISLIRAIRGPQSDLVHMAGKEGLLVFAPSASLRRKAWLALFALAVSTVALAYGSPFAGGPLDDFGFRVVYAGQARDFARHVLAAPERYVQPNDIMPTAIPRDRVPGRLRRLGRARVLNPSPTSAFAVSEPCIAFDAGGGFGHFGYLVGRRSLRVEGNRAFPVQLIVPGIYQYTDG